MIALQKFHMNTSSTEDMCKKSSFKIAVHKNSMGMRY